jgi:hypothetical protein
LVMESGMRGVLDRPIESGDDESLWSGAVALHSELFRWSTGQGTAERLDVPFAIPHSPVPACHIGNPCPLLVLDPTRNQCSA